LFQCESLNGFLDEVLFNLEVGVEYFALILLQKHASGKPSQTRLAMPCAPRSLSCLKGLSLSRRVRATNAVVPSFFQRLPHLISLSADMKELEYNSQLA